MTITITNVNDKPIAEDDEFTTPEETQVQGDVLGNDSDVECRNSLKATRLTDPNNGVVDRFNTSGSFAYTPNEDFAGTDSFVYKIEDCGGKTDTATGMHKEETFEIREIAF